MLRTLNAKISLLLHSRQSIVRSYNRFLEIRHMVSKIQL